MSIYIQIQQRYSCKQNGLNHGSATFFLYIRIVASICGESYNIHIYILNDCWNFTTAALVCNIANTHYQCSLLSSHFDLNPKPKQCTLHIECLNTSFLFNGSKQSKNDIYLMSVDFSKISYRRFADMMLTKLFNNCITSFPIIVVTFELALLISYSNKHIISVWRNFVC